MVEEIVRRGLDIFTPAQHIYYPFAIAKGEGTVVTATDGKRYLDFTSGLAVLNLGHNHPAVMEAVRGQLERCLHTGGIYYNEATVTAAEELVGIAPSGLDMLFFSNSGAEAVEGALKLSRFVSRRQILISCTGAFHGRTLGAVSITSSTATYRRRYHPLLPSVYQVPYPTCVDCPCGGDPNNCDTRCLAFLERLFEYQVPPEEVAAFIIEPFQGEGGYHPAPARYLQGVRKICDDYGILLIFDEVQSGIGRTGRWFAGEYSAVTPDIITVGKAIASGLPLSAVVARGDLMRSWELGCHGTTFGGNPVSCAAAVATLKAIREEGILERARESGRKALKALHDLAQQHSCISSIRGHGLMIGVEFTAPDGSPDTERCSAVIDYCLRNGIILIGCGLKRNVVRFIPPLNVTDAELEEGLQVLAEGIAEQI